MSHKFDCKECGAGELAFHAYVKCLTPVVIKEDGNLEYLEAVMDSDDYIQNTGFFCCFGCGSPAMKDNRNESSITTPAPDIMTEHELVEFLRIPKVSKATNYSNVVKNLIRFRDLPRIEICNKLLYPRRAVLEWVENQTIPK